ncbi:MAG: type I-E CRISPR-associated protein Cas5/CasD [Verrucomicrobia bacterium]|nr:type I-E CRISPR-associated protein Cas5/CasD [Verrucomicrobiota bacterium]
MSPEQHLALLLDAPLQSWGFASRFQRRTTGMHPTKSAVLGLLAAALGVDKHAPGESAIIEALARLRFTAVTLPRLDASESDGRPIRRLEDYHTVKGTRRASGKIDDGTVQSYRHYLLDARFGVLLTAPPDWQLPDGRGCDALAERLRDPVWGVWFGRKCCIPAAPVFVGGPLPAFEEAWRALLRAARLPGDALLSDFSRVEEADSFGEGIDTINDQPVTFAKPNAHAPRRIKVISRSR